MPDKWYYIITGEELITRGVNYSFNGGITIR